MLADFRDLQDDLLLEADICIIGAGAAGITIAKSLAGTQLKVCLLESGGLDYEPDTQALYDGVTEGHPWYDALSRERDEWPKLPELTFSRVRFFGGSTNHWGNGCVPLDDIDFIARPWVPHSGWPIARRDLDPYYLRAQLICRTRAAKAPPPLALDPARLVYHPGLLGPVNFGKAYREELQHASNVRVLLHANLLELVATQEARAVEKARFATLEGKHGTVCARFFVLACGGIENARLLLLSNSVARTGLGNTYDLVGRFFMDHPRGECGRIYDGHRERITPQGWYLAPQLEERDKTLQAFARFVDREDGAIPEGIAALRKLEAAFSSRTMPPNVGELIKRVVFDLGHVIPGFYRRETGSDVIANHYIELEGQFEQAPNPDSRVTLSDEVDRLGQRKTVLDWRFTELDRHTYRCLAVTVAAQLGSLGLGRVHLSPWLNPNSISNHVPELGGASHHMGTTRMSDDPRRGVVDRDCCVHGIANLFVAGSSCFPTGGCGFPTFTIVALAIRLADQLKERLRFNG